MNIVSRLGATILALVIAFPVFAQSTSPTGKTAPVTPSATAPAQSCNSGGNFARTLTRRSRRHQHGLGCRVESSPRCRRRVSGEDHRGPPLQDEGPARLTEHVSPLDLRYD